MAITVTATPGKQFAPTEKITIPKLNQLGQPVFTITGTVGVADIADDSLTAAKLAPGALYYPDSVSFLNGDYTLTYSPAPTVVDGMLVAFKASANGVPFGGTGIRLIIGASTKKLFKNKTEAIAPGDLVANQIIEARYDTTGDAGAGAWQMTSQLSNLPDYFSATVGGTANAITLTITPPASYPLTLANLEGKRIRFEAALDNTAPVTVAVTIGATALGAKNLKKNFNVALVASDIRANQMVDIVYETTTDAYQMQSALGNVSTDAAPVASSRKLVISNQLGLLTFSATDVQIQADEVVLRNSAGLNYSARNVSVTASIAGTVGTANALDVGAEAANTWYYIWLIYNGSATNSLLSVSSTSPTLPSGYTYKALVGQIQNDGSSNFFKTKIIDRRQWQETKDIAASINGVTAYTLLSGTPLTDFNRIVPPNAQTACIVIGRLANSDYGAAVAMNTDGVAEEIQNGTGTAGLFNGMNGASTFEVPMGNFFGATNFAWKVDSAAAAGYKIQCTGFTF